MRINILYILFFLPIYITRDIKVVFVFYNTLNRYDFTITIYDGLAIKNIRNFTNVLLSQSIFITYVCFLLASSLTLFFHFLVSHRWEPLSVDVELPSGPSHPQQASFYYEKSYTFDKTMFSTEI